MNTEWKARDTRQNIKMPKKRATYTINEDLLMRFKDASQQDHRKMSNVVERAIHNYWVGRGG